jgi:integrase
MRSRHELGLNLGRLPASLAVGGRAVTAWTASWSSTLWPRPWVGRARGRHPTHVFAYRNAPVQRILNSAWKRARIRAGLERVRVHDLKHTFGRRLREAGVSFEDRQDLLGHRSSRVTTHYSAAELGPLIEAAESVCLNRAARPELVVLRGVLRDASRKLLRRSREGATKPLI